ncbi:MAG: hypothetical protein HFF15_01785 [Angelakisella sp.]|nr:hypothetical protein [Angelakisella sp.]
MKTEENTMKNNTYFQTMNQISAEFGKAQAQRKAEKDAIRKAGDWAALDAWHEREKGFKYPFTNGQDKAFCAWFESVRDESSTFEVRDLPWDKDTHDFVETLRAAGITEFAVTDQSTALMRLLHLLAAEGCTMQELCKVTRNEICWGYEGTAGHDGILFHTYSNHQNCRHPSGRQLSQLPLSQKLESHQGFLRFWGFGS